MLTRLVIRIGIAVSLLVCVPASAATFDVKALIDTDNSRATGCNVVTVGGIVGGIDVIVTTSGTVTGATGTVTAVTRQTCMNPVLNQFSSATPVDGGWNVGVSTIGSTAGDVTVESHMGLDVLTMDNIGTPRFVFMTSSGLSSDVLLTPWSWGGGDIIMPHAARDRAVAPTPRSILLDGGSADWAGNVPLANGTAASPVWRFISARGYAGLHDLFFNFQIHTNIAAPTAHDDNYSLSPPGGTLTVATLGVLNNDNPNGQPITASLADSTQHGTLALAPDGGFTYIHDGSLASQDQFHYVAAGTTLSSNLATVTIDLPGTHPYTFTSAGNTTFIDGQPNSFLVTVAGKPTPALSVTGELPDGVTFQDNGNGTGVLSGTPGPNTSGNYPLVFFADKNKPHSSSQNFTLTVTCPGTVVQNPSVTTGTAGTAFSQTFTQSGGTPPVNFVINSGTLPPGLTLSSAGVLSGTPAGSGTFPITVKVTDVGGCIAVGPTYNLGISCHTVTVNNPPTSTGTASIALSQTFTQSGAVGGATFALNSGTLPTGLTLSGAGVLAGTPTQTGSFPITVKVTDGQGCIGVGGTYTLIIACQTITVTNPATNTGVASAAFSQTFTSGNTSGAVTYSTASMLPAGLTLSSSGVLSGTPTQTGSFPIVLKATDANGCFGSGSTYTLTVTCQTITVTNPATSAGTVSAPFSKTFAQSASIGAITFSLNSGALPAGLTLSGAGVLSGTPTQTGSFPITVKATDANGCTGIGATYTITIGCQTIIVASPATAAGTVNAAFSQQFTHAGAVGGQTFTLNTGTLPAGFTLSASGLLSGTTAQFGSFPITVNVTDGNSCTGISATYNLVINCQAITVNSPGTTSGVAGTAFNQTFTQTNASGGATFSLSSGTLPAGLTLSAAGLLSGTPAQTGSFPITVKVTDSNGCTGIGGTYNLVINCQTIAVTNPVTTTGVAGTAFSQTFTQSGSIGGVTFSLNSGTLPAGLTLSNTGLLSGTPTQTGFFPITAKVTDGNGCTGIGASYNLVINCQTITVTNPGASAGIAGTAFSQTFTQASSIGGSTFSLNSGSLPAGLTLSAAGLLSGTPTQTGSFPITVKVTDGNGCTGTGATYTITIGCQTISVTNPATATGTIQVAFSQNFTQSGAIGGAAFSLNSGSLPAGVTLASNGLLSGTPTVTGSFPITVKVTDGNGCTGVSATYTLVISCQTITVTNPATTTGTVSAPFTQTFTQTGANGTVTFTTASPLPAGLSLSTAGVLSGTPAQSGTFPIVVTVTDSNGCTGTGATYTLIVGCQTITVTNPATISNPAGVPLSINFTQTGAIGTATFTTGSTLPTGLILDPDGTLHGTPSGSGAFPIVVTLTDSNNCTGTNPSYTLTITCPTITVTNPGVSTGTSGVAFNQTFTQVGGQGTITWSRTGALPAGITLNAASGVLSGTTSAAGSFPITVTATDSNGCTGTGATYTLTINCQTINVTNPGVNTGTVDTAFSQTFTKTGILGTVTWSETGPLPAGILLNSATGVLAGTPAVDGSFPITVTATDTNGCSGSSPYTLTINCQTITVSNPGVTTGTVDAVFSQTFTQSGAHGTATFTAASGLPAGLLLSTAGVLSGTPTVKGTFPIVVTVTDSNGCTGTGATYTLIIGCQTITVTNPATTTGTAGTAFSQNFTQSGAHGTATFTSASTLPAGFTLSAAGLLSGTTTQHGSFPIVITVTDANTCTGTSATYNLNIACNAISVTNPATTTGTVASVFSQTFTSSGTLGTPSYTTASTLPAGLTLHAATGILDGTPTQSGTFPIVVTVTDSNGCTGTGATYTLVIGCNVITVTSPGVTSGTAGVVFDQAFTQLGGNGTITWSKTGDALPAGILLNSSTGHLAGTTNQTGIFNITVTATDGNNCSGSTPYTLTINCQTITVTNPATTTVQAGVPLDVTFTASGILGTVTWSKTGDTLPGTLALNPATGHLTGTANATGTFNITVKAQDTNGCFGTLAYTLTVTCPTITVTRTGGGTFPNGVFNTAYAGQSVVAAGGGGSYTYAIASGALPTGLSLTAATGAITGTATATGNFTFTITATDTNSSCTGTSASLSISIAPAANTESYGAAFNIVDNTQFVVTGGSTASPGTPFVGNGTLNILTNDSSDAAKTATAGTFATSGGGSVTIAADGTFIYTPAVHPAAITSDSFTYTIVSNGVTSIPATVNLTLANRVWYVKDNGGGSNGQSQSPFTTLALAQTASAAGDIIFVYTGNTVASPLAGDIILKDGQKLWGQGIGLTVNTVSLVTAGTQSRINNTGGDAVSVPATAGNRQNVEIQGLDLQGSLNGVDVTSSGANALGVTISNNTFRAAGAEDIDVNSGSTSATAAVTIQNNDWVVVGPHSNNGIDVRATAGTLNLNVSTNTNINVAGTGILIDGSVGGTINITGFNDNFVHQNTIGNGITVVSATFDTTPGGAFQTVPGGTTRIGTVGNGVGGAGMTLANVAGDLSFIDLDITNDNGAGLKANGLTGYTGSAGFQIAVASAVATINTVGGPALDLNTVTANLPLSTVISTSSPTTGLSLVTVAGTVSAPAGSALSGDSGATFNVNGGTVNATWSGNLTQATASQPLVSVSNSHSGTLTFNTGTLSATNGTGLQFDNADGTYNFNGTNTMNGGDAGIDIVNNSAGTFSFSSNTSITSPTGYCFAHQNSSAGVTYSGNMTQASAGQRMIDISNQSSGTITFQTGTLSATNGDGIQLLNADGTVNFNGTTILNGGDAGIDITTGSGGTFSFNSNTSITNPSGTAFNFNASTANVTYSGSMTKSGAGAGQIVDIVGQASGTITFQTGTLSSTATSGTGINLSNVDGTVNFNGTTTLNGGDASVDIIAGSSGTIVFSSNASINNPSGIAYNEDTSTATVTFGGPITKNNNSNNAVNINAKTGGTTTFNGAITGSTGTANAIDLTANTGGTVAFTGALTLTTSAGVAFNATGGGTVSVTNAGNTVTTGAGGTGINWNGVTGSSTETFSTVTGSGSGIGMSITGSLATNFTVGTVSTVTGTAVSITTATGDFIFTKISSSGAAKGISVTALTGAGSFTVNGTGGLCDSTHVGAGDCTGGTITGGTTRGAEFSNAVGVTLNNMYFNGNGTTDSGGTCVDSNSAGASNVACNAALYLVNATTVGLTKIYLNGTGSADMGLNGNAVNGLLVSGLEIANFSGVHKDAATLQNLTGTSTFAGLNVHNNTLSHNFFVSNVSGTANITFTSPIIATSPFDATKGNADGLQVDSYVSANVTVSATNINIHNLAGNSVSFQANSGSTMVATLNGGTSLLTNGILMQSAGTNTNFTYTVTNLTSVTTNPLGSNAITVGKANGTNGMANGTVTNNIIGNSPFDGINLNSYGVSGASTVTVTGNTISNTNRAISATAGQGGSSFNVIIQSNTIGAPVAGTFAYAIDIVDGTQSGDSECLFLNLGDMSVGHTVPANKNNISTTGWQSGGNPIEAAMFNNTIFKMLNFPGGADAGAASWVTASNTIAGGLGTDAFHLGTNQFTAGASCP
jgi:hypothetical protein